MSRHVHRSKRLFKWKPIYTLVMVENKSTLIEEFVYIYILVLFDIKVHMYKNRLTTSTYEVYNQTPYSKW